jgi:glutamine synthetase
VAGGDVNPYLMLAAILGSALDGIEHQMEAPSPIVGNAYAIDDLPEIPTTWAAAIDALEQSTIVPRFLHPELIKNLVSTKRQELHYTAELNAQELIELYLDTV